MYEYMHQYQHSSIAVYQHERLHESLCPPYHEHVPGYMAHAHDMAHARHVHVPLKRLLKVHVIRFTASAVVCWPLPLAEKVHQSLQNMSPS